LKTNWQQTKKVLVNDLKSKDDRKVKNAVCTLIALGNEEVVNELVNLIENQGNKTIAGIYIKSGHKKLEDAARSWAKKNNVSVDSLSNPYPISWSSWK
ncbi:MAG: hypothetical protein ACK4E1_07500, partial [Fervidobacterium nodosum]